MSFKKIGDGELIYLIRSNNAEAKEYFFERYKKRIYGMIKSFIATYKMVETDFNDYYQSCYISFLRCLELFDDDYNFYSYLKMAIENSMYKMLEKDVNNKEILSLENDLNERDYYQLDCVSDSSQIYKERELLEIIDKNFIGIDKDIIKLKIKGYSCVEIAKTLNKNKKEIYRRVQKIRNIMKNELINR